MTLERGVPSIVYSLESVHRCREQSAVYKRARLPSLCLSHSRILAERRASKDKTRKNYTDTLRSTAPINL